MAKEDQLNENIKVSDTTGTDTAKQDLSKYHRSHSGLGLVLGLLMLGLFVLLVISFGVLFWFNGTNHQLMAPMQAYRIGNMHNEIGGDFEQRGGGMMGGRRGLTNSQQIGGVVTAINGQTFIVAGEGITNTVKTTSGTQYKNGTKVNVNDSVLVMGTTANSEFTAATVFVNPGKITN